MSDDRDYRRQSLTASHRRSRSRSPYRHSRQSPRKRSSSRDRRHRQSTPPKPVKLPLHARPISKHDFEAYKPLFTLYLDVQKQIHVEDLDDRQVRGRWKSFVGKWNRGELSEGWYDPVTRRKADASGDLTSHDREPTSPPPPKRRRHSPPIHDDPPATHKSQQDATASDDEDDEIGPAPLGSAAHNSRAGPSIPTRQDLDLRNELAAEDALARRDDVRYDRKLERKAQRERLDEIAPRADAGTRERQLEKRADIRAVHASFRDSKETGETEVGEGDLLGDDGIEGYKAVKREAEKRKNEREVRKEEIWRARAEEREERLKEARSKEEKTMEFLRGLARQRFGGGGGDD